MTTEAPPYGKVLDEQGVHRRLVQDLAGVAKRANVPVGMIKTSAKSYLTMNEVDKLRILMKAVNHGTGGMCLTGKGKHPAATKMWAIGGALLRHYIDVRVMTVNDVIAAHDDGEMPEPTVLLIPNFYVDPSKDNALAAWKVQVLYDLLMARYVASRPTIIHVERMDGLKHNYGEALHDFIRSHWTMLGENN